MSDFHNEFFDLLETMADNKFVLGDKLVEIGISGPELEATHSAIALAQSELGHARHLYNWSLELKETEGEISEQSGKAFKSLMTIHNWVSLIAGVYTLNCAVELVIEALLASDKEGIEKRASKLLNELREPLVFSSQWSHRLLNEGGSIPRYFLESLRTMETDITAWLKEIQSNQVLKENQYIKSEDLAGKFLRKIEELSLDKIEVS